MIRTALMMLLAFCFCSSAFAGDRPNILFFLADDVGVDAIGCYGGESYKTPRLDELAAGGTRFDYCFAMPVCHPTRICLLTGRYPFRLSNPRWGSFPKQTEQQTLAHVLKRAGYATAIAGKWQLTMMRDDLDHAERLGFDQSCLFGWHEGPRYYEPLIYQNGKLRGDAKDQYGPDVYTDFLINFMEANRDKPFFAFYSMAFCHDVTDDLDKPVPHGPKGRYDSYQEMIEGMDERVGRLVDAVDRLGLRKKTLILFTTDNGTPKRSYISANADGSLNRDPVFSVYKGKRVQGGKGNLTNDGTHVPLIANWPDVVPADTVSNSLVDMSDFLPTFAELAKGETPDVPLDGTSFVAQLRGESTSARNWVFAERGRRAWVRTQRWKLYSDGVYFDVAADASEKKPVDAANLTGESADTYRRLATAMKSLSFGS